MARRRVCRSSPSINPRLDFRGSVVKSAARVFEVLEFFDDVQGEATIGDVSEALGYPQSSTSALLRSLVMLGYLSHNPQTRTYVTSSRVALLGNWRNTPFFQDGMVIQFVKELNAHTGEAVVLAVRNGLHAQYIYVRQALAKEVPYRIAVGTARSLVLSGTGNAILMTMSDPEVVKLIHRINAGQTELALRVRVGDILTTLAESRAQGHVFFGNDEPITGNPAVGAGILASPLSGIASPSPLVVGIGGPRDVMLARRDELADILKSLARDYFPAAARATEPDAREGARRVPALQCASP